MFFQRQSFYVRRTSTLFLVIQLCLLCLYCTCNTDTTHTARIDMDTRMLKSFSCVNCLAHTHTWQLCQEASSRSILLYSFICFVMKANFWKLTLAVTSICFRHLWAMQIKPMNIQTGLSLEAQVLRLAYSWWRESCGPSGRRGKKKREVNLRSLALHLPILSFSV